MACALDRFGCVFDDWDIFDGQNMWASPFLICMERVSIDVSVMGKMQHTENVASWRY